MKRLFDDIWFFDAHLSLDSHVFSYFLLKLLINTILLSNLWVIH